MPRHKKVKLDFAAQADQTSSLLLALPPEIRNHILSYLLYSLRCYDNALLSALRPPYRKRVQRQTFCSRLPPRLYASLPRIHRSLLRQRDFPLQDAEDIKVVESQGCGEEAQAGRGGTCASRGTETGDGHEVEEVYFRKVCMVSYSLVPVVRPYSSG